MGGLVRGFASEWVGAKVFGRRVTAGVGTVTQRDSRSEGISSEHRFDAQFDTLNTAKDAGEYRYP